MKDPNIAHTAAAQEPRAVESAREAVMNVTREYKAGE